MNGKDIFLGLKYVGEDLIQEAEYGQFHRRGRLKKPLLIAALIALSLLLTGCAVAYLLHLQDLKVSEVKTTKPIFENGIKIAGYEEITQQTLTLGGLKGTPAYQAAVEWHGFLENYERKETSSDLPEEYAYYGVDSQEMKDALDGILKKYNLKLMGMPLEFDTTEAMCAALGIEKMLTAENEVFIACRNGLCMENGNFRMELDIRLPKGEGLLGRLYWSRKDCLNPETILITDQEGWKEWNYTTASGRQVLMARADTAQEGWILCDRPEATLSVGLTVSENLTSQQMEQIADAFDFGIQPNLVSQVQNQPHGENVTQDGYTIGLKSVEADGVTIKITLGITAPEGVNITNQEDIPFGIQPANDDLLSPATGEGQLIMSTVEAREDGDGLNHTQELVIESIWEMADGSKPFAPGMVWNLVIEDLINRFWWYPDVEDTALAYGVWQFEITIGDRAGDLLEIELVPEPINVQAYVGWRADGTNVLDCYDDLLLQSFTLRTSGATILTDKNNPGNLIPDEDSKIFVVMKDGSRIELKPEFRKVGTIILSAESPIDLNQADHVLLPDGTNLPVI